MSDQQFSSKIPTPDSSVVLAIKSSTTITASPEHIFRITTTPGEFSKWNTFAVSGEIKSGPTSDNPSVVGVKEGDLVTLQCRMQPTDSGLQSANLRVTEVTIPEDPTAKGAVFRVSWISEGIASRFMLKTNRVQEVEVLGDGTCEFRTWEHMSGPLAYVVKRMYGECLQDRFVDWSRDLKAYAESSK